MGWSVESEGKLIWEPSLNTGFLFLGELAALERLVGGRSGVIDLQDDTMEIIPVGFDLFIKRVLAYLDRTNSGAVFALVEGCLAVCLALNHEITGRWPDVPERLRPIVEKAKTVMRAVP